MPAETFSDVFGENGVILYLLCLIANHYSKLIRLLRKAAPFGLGVLDFGEELVFYYNEVLLRELENPSIRKYSFEDCCYTLLQYQEHYICNIQTSKH